MDKLRKELLAALLIGAPMSTNEATIIAEAIEALIDAKIADAVYDLRAEINKTGIYDPDW